MQFDIQRCEAPLKITLAQEESIECTARELRVHSERGFSGRRTYANSNLSERNSEIAQCKRVSNTLVYALTAMGAGARDNVVIGVIILLRINKKLCSLKPSMLFCPIVNIRNQWHDKAHK